MRYRALLLALLPAFALTAAAQQSGSADRYINPAPQLTSDSDFFNMAAENHAYIASVTSWAKNHGTGHVRQTAQRLLFQQSESGDSFLKMAKKKNMDVTWKLNTDDAIRRARLESMPGPNVDRFFIGQLLNRYTQQIAWFHAEAGRTSDPDIKKWINDAIPRLQDQRDLVLEVKHQLP